MFEEGEKYNGLIPQIKYLPTHAIEHSGQAGEVHHVDDEVAKNMDFSAPVEATAFRYGRNHDEFEPSVQISDGHHRLAAAKQIGRPHLPVNIIARNAKGEKLNALKALSDEIESKLAKPAIGKEGGGPVEQDGITAYHGSPHEFEQFDTSKIGTGEGAQSYGHGLYFAGHEPVAKEYRDRLAKEEASSGETIADQHVIAPHFYKDMSDQEIAEHMDEAASWADKKIFDQGKMKYLYDDGSMLIHDEDRVRAVQKQPGHMYEVHINAHPHHMLDWDKPLSEQPSHITKSLFDARKELPTLWQKTQHHINNDSTAGDFYQSVAAGHPHGYAGATEQLSRAGIKGIKYLDAGSRGDKAEPTHNYVVFNHNDVEIKRKYEQGGAVEGFADGGSVHDQFLPHDHPQRQQNLGEFLKESAIKHPDGRPKVVYHNTSRSFNEFRTAKSEMGAHFGTPAQANDILEVIHDKPDHQGYPVYLNLKNPLRLRDTGTFDTYRVHRQLKEMGLDKGLPKNPHQLEMQEHLQSLGYDGVVYLNRREGISRAKGKDPERYNDYSDQMFKHHFPDAEDSYIAFDPTQIKSAIGNNGYYDQNEPDITKAEGGDVWDDSRVRRSGEGGQETALDFIQNAPLYKQRMEAQAPQPAPAAAPLIEVKPMPVTAAAPPAIVQPAQPVQQKQEQPQGQVGLYAVGTNDPNPDMTVQSAQRIIESSRAMGINPVFLLPNQAGGTQYAKNSKALQNYLDTVGIQYQMPQYGDKDPLHMTPSWASGAAKSYEAPFLAGDSNSVRMGIVGYGAKGDGKTLVHPESGAVLGRVGANSKAVADELERHLRWQQQNRTQRNTGGPVNVSKGQDTAGNFKKEHEKIHGIPVAIEVKEGHDRVKYEPDGSVKFKAKQYADYGAILGTKDADGMNTDVMVGPHKDSNKAYIIDQRKHSTGKFDEHKVMLGFNKRKKAIKAYTKSYADRHGKDRVQDVVKTDIAGLKKWLKRGDLKKSAAKDALINRALEVVSKKT